jgi:spore coat polysaccharide biosynthesis protein SpsF
MCKNEKVGITLQALMRSTRLKNKPILKLCDREMIAHQIDRLKTAKIPREIVLCTSQDPEDQILVEIAKREGIKIFTGPKDDVLLRLAMAADRYGFDYIVATSGDNPLTDAEHIDDLARLIVEDDLDYVDGYQVLPIGLFAKAMKVSAIRKVIEIKSIDDSEGLTSWFYRLKSIFKVAKAKAQPWVFDNDFRLTVDTPEDFLLMEAIFKKFYVPGKVFPLDKVLKYLNENPEITAINREIGQIQLHNLPFGVKKEYEQYLDKA